MSDIIKCYAVKNVQAGKFWYDHFGPEKWLRLCFSHSTIVPVELNIVPGDDAVEDDYYGFYYHADYKRLGKGQEGGLGSHPTLYDADVLLKIHFGGGYQYAVDRGEGHVVRVRVKEIANKEDSVVESIEGD